MKNRSYCIALRENCRFYANYPGIIRNNLDVLKETLQKMGPEMKEMTGSHSHLQTPPRW